MFNRIEEYVKISGNISKEGVDSVRHATTFKFAGRHPEVKAYLSGNPTASPDAQPSTLKLQVLLGETQAAIKNFNTRTGFKKLELQIGEINRKAAETLSEAEKDKVCAVSVTSYYSVRYWIENGLKWKEFGEYVKTKNKN
jgi:hypothetical protein